MELELSNKCSTNIVVSLNEQEKFVLSPRENKKTSLDSAEIINVTVRKEDGSVFEKNMFHKEYKLTIETGYSFRVDGRNVLPLVLLRECSRVSGNAYYEKIVLKDPPGEYLAEHNKICDSKSIETMYNKRYLAYELFVSPFEHLTGLCVAAFILAIVFACKIGLMFALIFFLISYSVITAIDMAFSKLEDLFNFKVLKLKNDKAEFEEILDENYLNSFYSGKLRAYMDEVYIDEV